MSIRHCKNATTRQVKRHVATQLTELFLADGTAFTGENHEHLVGADLVAPEPIFYPGYEHIPVGQVQYDLNAV